MKTNHFETISEKVKLIDWAKWMIVVSCYYPCDKESITEMIVSLLEKANSIKEKAAIAAVFSAKGDNGLYCPESGQMQFFMPKHEDCFLAFKEARKQLKKGYVNVSCFNENHKRFSLRIDAKYKSREEYDSQKRIIFFADNFGKEIHYRYDSEGNQYYSKNNFEWYDSSSRLVYNSSRGTKYIYNNNKCIAIHKDGTVHDYNQNNCNHILNHKYMIKQNDEGKYVCSLCGTTFTSVPSKQRG